MQHWQTNVERHRAREEAALRFELSVAERERNRQWEARALNQQSLISWQNALQVAYKDVRDALVSLREDGEAERAQASRVANARHTLGLTQLRLQAGHASQLDVLDSQRTFNDAQLTHIAARQAQLNASVALFKALGGGWTPTPSAR